MRGRAALIIAVPMLAACQGGGAHSSGHHASPAHVEKIAGSDISKITLTPKAAERLGIETGQVQAMVARAGAIAAAGGGAVLQGDPRTRAVRSAVGGSVGGSRLTVPYAAVIYDAHGDAWVYTNPEPLVFIRHRIKIDYIEGDRAVLSEGPPVGTAVVTFGAAELFGTEFEVGH